MGLHSLACIAMTVTRLARAARSTLQPGISGLKAGVSTETSSIVQHVEGSSKVTPPPACQHVCNCRQLSMHMGAQGYWSSLCSNWPLQQESRAVGMWSANVQIAGTDALQPFCSVFPTFLVLLVPGRVQDAWEQSEEVLQGGIERAQRSTPLGTTPDILMMSASLAELQFLQCKWHDASATASAIDIADPGLFSSQDASVASTSAFNERPALQTAQGILVSVDALSRLASVRESLTHRHGYLQKPARLHVAPTRCMQLPTLSLCTRTLCRPQQLSAHIHIHFTECMR